MINIVLKGSIPKSKIPNCPGCGKPRKKYDLSHGECMERVARQEQEEGKTAAVIFKTGRTISKEAKRKSRDKASRRFYNAKNLPDYMFS